MQPTLDLASIKAALFDMDGVIWRGADVLPGVTNLFQFLRQCGIHYALATNNASKSVADYVERLSMLGVPITPQQIVTSSAVTADTLTQRYEPGTPIYVIGTEKLHNLIAEQGFTVTAEGAQAVVVGLNPALSYDMLKVAGRLILNGAAFIGTNNDVTFPAADGLAPGNGSILAAISAMTGQRPEVMGKPEPAMFETALRRFGVAPAQALMVGDRLDTDIDGARRVGMRTALVLTGITGRTDAMRALQDSRLDAVYEGLPELLAAWQ